MAPRPRSGVSLASAPAMSPPPTSSGIPTRTSAASGGSRAPFALAAVGERGYLYMLVILELAAIAGLRYLFRGNHGG